MDKTKINKAIDALGLSVNHKNTLKAALNEGAGDGMIELETKVDDIDKEESDENYDLTKDDSGKFKRIDEQGREIN